MNINKAKKRLEKQVFIAQTKEKKFNFDGITLQLISNNHNRPSLTFSTPKCYKIHQGVVLQLQYEYYAIIWKILPMH
jgi:hypothetical protein